MPITTILTAANNARHSSSAVTISVWWKMQEMLKTAGRQASHTFTAASSFSKAVWGFPSLAKPSPVSHNTQPSNSDPHKLLGIASKTCRLPVKSSFLYSPTACKKLPSTPKYVFPAPDLVPCHPHCCTSADMSRKAFKGNRLSLQGRSNIHAGIVDPPSHFESKGRVLSFSKGMLSSGRRLAWSRTKVMKEAHFRCSCRASNNAFRSSPSISSHPGTKGKKFHRTFIVNHTNVL